MESKNGMFIEESIITLIPCEMEGDYVNSVSSSELSDSSDDEIDSNEIKNFKKIDFSENEQSRKNSVSTKTDSEEFN